MAAGDAGKMLVEKQAGVVLAAPGVVARTTFP